MAKSVNAMPLKALDIGPSHDGKFLIFEIKTAAQGTCHYSMQIARLNPVIENMLIVSMMDGLVEHLPKPAPMTAAHLEERKSFPLTAAAAYHVPISGAAGITLQFLSGLRLSGEMGPDEAEALAQQLQTAAAKARAASQSAKGRAN